ncbi:MAG: hypothetical protein RI993_1239 [Pseudomonadota bacterium]|jgi:dihydrolipoamide dehydrogenase
MTMTKLTQITLPDIGDYHDVPVVEILAKPGDQIGLDTPLLTLESDKATVEVPSPQAGTIKTFHVKVGDKVSKGALIATLEVIETTDQLNTSQSLTQTTTTTGIQESRGEVHATRPSSAAAFSPAARSDLHVEVVVLGAGPGGYTAAFRAADLGKQVALIERYPELGGVCLNVGCIPSKALLHIAKVLTEAQTAHEAGIEFGQPRINLEQLRRWKDGVIKKLTQGLLSLARQRKVTVIQGIGKFISPNAITIETPDGIKTVSFDHCVIASGSSSAKLPGLPNDARIIDSTGALALHTLPKRMLILGGGIIGLEMATVYHALGTKVSIVEQLPQLIPGADSDLVKPLFNKLKQTCEAIWLNTSVSQIEASKKGLKVTFTGEQAPAAHWFDVVLVAIGRRPNSKLIAAEFAGVAVDTRGFIVVDEQMRTNVSHIFAIGDITGEPMLAHKASHQGKIAAEVIAGHKVAFDTRTIPSVAYTDPEIAWMGLTETEARKQGTSYEKANFPWAASGRALAMGSETGLTKLLYDKTTRRILGAGITGTNAGDLIAELTLALEMGADMQDIALTIHPHPTLSETVMLAAEMAEGVITDLYLPGGKK